MSSCMTVGRIVLSGDQWQFKFKIFRYQLIDFFDALHWGESNQLGAEGKPWEGIYG